MSTEGTVLHRISSQLWPVAGEQHSNSSRPKNSVLLQQPTLLHTFKNAIKIASQAAGVQSIISLCLKLMNIRSIKSFRRIFTTFSSMSELLQTSLRFGLFIGLLRFAKQFVDILYLKSAKQLKANGSTSDDSELRFRARVKNFVTASLCAGALMIETPSRRHMISLFLFPRGLDALACIGVKKKMIPSVRNAPTILFIVRLPNN